MENSMKRLSLLVATLCTMTTLPVLAQVSGQNAVINVGTVQQAKPITLQSTGGGKGAVVGGALGYASGSSKKRSRRNAIIGGAAGAAVASSGASQGMQYTVKVNDGSSIVVISDQTEIQLGDCVTVEQVGNAANIRRQDPVACEAAGKAAVAAIQEELVEDANECAAVKQQIVDAKTKDKIEMATAKAKILCN
jgi:outer membrane lipoprotein SlyB